MRAESRIPRRPQTLGLMDAVIAPFESGAHTVVCFSGGTDPVNELGSAHRSRNFPGRVCPRPHNPSVLISDDRRTPRMLTTHADLLQ